MDCTKEKNRIANPSHEDKETARLPKGHSIKAHSENANYVVNALNRIGPALDEICVKRHWHKDAIKEHLDELYFPNDSTLSRIKNSTDGRKVSAGQLFELRRVSGISLDKLADGCDAFEFEEMSDIRLVELMEQISFELARRFRQK